MSSSAICGAVIKNYWNIINIIKTKTLMVKINELWR